MFGLLSTAVAILFIATGTLLDFEYCASNNYIPPLKTLELKNILSSLGTFLFTYGGHHAFPTIQHDMKKPAEFNKTTYLANFSLFYFLIFETLKSLVWNKLNNNN